MPTIMQLARPIMMASEKVNRFITGFAPKVLRDQCLVETLELPSNAHASQITVTLGTTSDFERVRERCGLCNNTKMVTRAVAA